MRGGGGAGEGGWKGRECREGVESVQWGDDNLKYTPPHTTSHHTTHARRRNKNLGDGIDYGQQHYECLGELISDTLQLLEQRGGPDAYINIK